MQNQLGPDPEFGNLSSELRAAWGMRILVMVLILFGCGLFVIASVSSDEMGLGITIGVVGLALIALVQFILSALRVRIYQHGIERRGRFGTKRIAWANLKSYQLQMVDPVAIAGAAGGLVGVLVARGIQRAFKKEVVPNAVILSAKDGTKIALAGNVAGYRELIRTLVPFLTEQLFVVAKQTYDSGAELKFGKKLTLQRGVGVTFTGLFGKKHVLSLEQIAGATLDRAALVIRRNDTNAVWQSVPATSVLDIGVFQKLIEVAGKPYDERLPLAWTN
jgi:hypothetical protein